MTIAMKIKCLPEPEVQFNNGRLDVDPRRALALSGPVDHRGQRTFRLGLIGLGGDVAAARGWLRDMNLYRPAKEKNARRFRDWPGVEKALKVKFEVDEEFVRSSTAVNLTIISAPRSAAMISMHWSNFSKDRS